MKKFSKIYLLIILALVGISICNSCSSNNNEPIPDKDKDKDDEENFDPLNRDSCIYNGAEGLAGGHLPWFYYNFEVTYPDGERILTPSSKEFQGNFTFRLPIFNDTQEVIINTEKSARFELLQAKYTDKNDENHYYSLTDFAIGETKEFGQGEVAFTKLSENSFKIKIADIADLYSWFDTQFLVRTIPEKWKICECYNKLHNFEDTPYPDNDPRSWIQFNDYMMVISLDKYDLTIKEYLEKYGENNRLNLIK